MSVKTNIGILVMKDMRWILFLFVSSHLSKTAFGQCDWERTEGHNVVGQRLDNIVDITLTECQGRCEDNPDCRSIDYGEEDGIKKCDLNEVNGIEATRYIETPGVDNYACARNHTQTQEPYVEEDDEGYWMEDAPEYYVMIGLGFVILLLLAVILITLCCFVGGKGSK